jgi:hypothetical protein
MANPNDPAENLKWFYEHCASHHYLLETAMPMLDVAVFILHHIKKLDILFVSNQVKADLARSIVNFTKTQCSENTCWCTWNQSHLCFWISWLMRISNMIS